MQPTIALPLQFHARKPWNWSTIFGDVLVPLEQVRERWFRNLNKENFSKAWHAGGSPCQ